MILTGLAQSPAIEASQPWLPGIFGGRQGARSIHFIGMCAFAAFTLMHLAMVMHTRLDRNLSEMIFGTPNGNGTAALGIAIFINVAILLDLLGILAVLTLSCEGNQEHPWPLRPPLYALAHAARQPAHALPSRPDLALPCHERLPSNVRGVPGRARE